MTLQSNSMEEIRRFEVKKPSEELQDPQVGRKYDFLENFLVPWLNSKDVPAEHAPAPGVVVTLEQSELWQQFFDLTNEMIVTRRGRKMFPVIKLGVYGLEDKAAYLMVLEFVQIKDSKYRFLHGDWNTTAPGKAEPTRQPFCVNPKGIQLGEIWQRDGISFSEVKITNDKNGSSPTMMSLNSMHVYEPRLHMISMKHTDNLGWSPTSMCTEKLQLTSFVAVTAYQNDKPSVTHTLFRKVTQLKVKYNPFARAFNRAGAGASDLQLASATGVLPLPEHQAGARVLPLPEHASPTQGGGWLAEGRPRVAGARRLQAERYQLLHGSPEDGSLPASKAYTSPKPHSQQLISMQMIQQAQNHFNNGGAAFQILCTSDGSGATPPSVQNSARQPFPGASPRLRTLCQQQHDRRHNKMREGGSYRAAPYYLQQHQARLQQSQTVQQQQTLYPGRTGCGHRVTTNSPSPSCSSEGSCAAPVMTTAGYNQPFVNQEDAILNQAHQFAHLHQQDQTNSQQQQPQPQYASHVGVGTPSPASTSSTNPHAVLQHYQQVQYQFNDDSVIMSAEKPNLWSGYNPETPPEHFDTFTAQTRLPAPTYPSNYSNNSFCNSLPESHCVITPPQCSPASGHVLPPSFYQYHHQQQQQHIRQLGGHHSSTPSLADVTCSSDSCLAGTYAAAQSGDTSLEPSQEEVASLGAVHTRSLPADTPASHAGMGLTDQELFLPSGLSGLPVQT